MGHAISLVPEFQQLPEQRVLCATERGMVGGQMSAAADRAFARLENGVAALGLMPHVRGALGISPDVPKGLNDPGMRFVAAYVIDAAAPPVPAPPGLVWDTIAAGRWAVFRHVGPFDTLGASWRAIHAEWLPNAGVALREASPYERYENAHLGVPPAQLLTLIHMPVA
jgi:AraC family transcriptional regulator